MSRPQLIAITAILVIMGTVIVFRSMALDYRIGGTCDGRWREVPGGGRTTAVPHLIYSPPYSQGQYPGELLVVVKGLDDAAWIQVMSPGGPTWRRSWYSLGGKMLYGPTGYNNNNTGPWIEVVGIDGNQWVRVNSPYPTGWTPWRNRGSGKTYAPVSSSLTIGKTTYYVKRSGDNTIWYRCL